MNEARAAAVVDPHAPNAGPRYPRCGYLLVGLTQRPCPECGEPFDLAEVTRASELTLPWERPERGGVIRRVLATILFVWRLPFERFRPLTVRANRPIEGAPRLLVLLLIALSATLPLRFCLDVAVNVVTFHHQQQILVAKNPAPIAAWPVRKIIGELVRTMWSRLLARYLRACWETIVSVAGIAATIAWVHRRRGGVLTFTSVAVVLLSMSLFLHLLEAAILRPALMLGQEFVPGTQMAMSALLAVHWLWALYLPALVFLIARNVIGSSWLKTLGLVAGCWLAARAALLLSSLLSLPLRALSA